MANIKEFDAKTAAAISLENKKLSWSDPEISWLKRDIEEEAKKGEYNLKTHLVGGGSFLTLDEITKFLESKSFKVSHEIDCDNDYRGSWISW